MTTSTTMTSERASGRRFAAPMLRRILITELKFRDPELSKRLSSALAEHFRIGD